MRSQRLQKISEHVSIIPDGSVSLVPNVGFILGDKATLVVDTGLGPRNGAVVAQVAARLAGWHDLRHERWAAEHRDELAAAV